VQITKILIKKVMRLIFLQKEMKSLLPKLGEKLLLVKYLSVTANLIEGGIASRNFVSLPWILGPVFWSIISMSLFVILTKFLYPEPSPKCCSRRRSYPCWTPSNKPCVHKRFTYFGRYFLVIANNKYPRHMPAAT
jgi:hypothetical protein